MGEGADAGLVEAEAQDGGALDAGPSRAEDAGPDVHLPVPLRAVGALSRTDVWAFGVGAIFHFDGARWRDVTPEGAAQVRWTDAETSEGTVWAVGETASAKMPTGALASRSQAAGVSPGSAAARNSPARAPTNTV